MARRDSRKSTKEPEDKAACFGLFGCERGASEGAWIVAGFQMAAFARCGDGADTRRPLHFAGLLEDTCARFRISH